MKSIALAFSLALVLPSLAGAQPCGQGAGVPVGHYYCGQHQSYCNHPQYQTQHQPYYQPQPVQVGAPAGHYYCQQHHCYCNHPQGSWGYSNPGNQNGQCQDGGGPSFNQGYYNNGQRKRRRRPQGSWQNQGNWQNNCR